MFTGIIEALGEVAAVETRGGDRRLTFAARGYFDGVAPGDSIAVSGVCLTAVELGTDRFAADVSGETLAATTVGRWQVGDRVNLEKALTPAKPLGGHLVSGHVDGIGRLVQRREEARSWRLDFEAPAELARYIARKGSICVDGVSLTVNEVADAALTPPSAPQTVPPSPAARERDGRRRPGAAAVCFGVNIIPHTLTHTTLGGLREGDAVNLEVDLIARYLERLLMERSS